MKRQALLWVLWPGFLAAALMTLVVFALLDPLDMVFVGRFQASRMTVYTLGFFLFWAMAALSSALTLRLAGRPQAYDEFGDPLP